MFHVWLVASAVGLVAWAWLTPANPPTVEMDMERAEQYQQDHVADLTAGRDCSDPEVFDGIPADLVVRWDIAASGRSGVEVLDFDTAWAHAEAGKVWVLLACA